MEIHFVTPHGVYRIDGFNKEQTLEEVCLINRIPIQSTTIYGTTIYGGHSLIVGKHKKLAFLSEAYTQIHIRPDRNIDYRAICQKKIKIKPCSKAATEYTFPSPTGHELHHFEMNESDCKKYVAESVRDFLMNDVSLDSSSKIVLGVSGGGDSNTLVEAFLANGVQPKQIIAVMMLGIPDWDKGKDRAMTICENHQVELRFVEAGAVNRLLGRKKDSDWVEDFEKIFPDADLEVLGTLAIRLSLTYVAKSIGAQAIITGLNLEDILAECFLTTMQGQPPLPFPTREVDGIRIWYPLYKVPKKILDGCYPKFSLANYIDRYPSKLVSRANAYYLSQMLHAHLPGSEFDLLRGFQSLSLLNTSYSYYDETLGFSVTEKLPQDVKSAWLMFAGM